jgi:hypothetical protein
VLWSSLDRKVGARLGGGMRLGAVLCGQNYPPAGLLDNRTGQWGNSPDRYTNVHEDRMGAAPIKEQVNWLFNGICCGLVGTTP